MYDIIADGKGGSTIRFGRGGAPGEKNKAWVVMTAKYAWRISSCRNRIRVSRFGRFGFERI